MITKYFRAFRFGEVFILTGFVLIGGIFSFSSINQQVVVDAFLIFCIAFCSISSLYAFNAYQGHKKDKQNERLKALEEISSSENLIFFITIYSVSLVIGYFVQTHLVYLIILLGLLGIGYSLPGMGKDRPFAGTLIHLFFQITAFQIAYSVFQPISITSILLSIYFSLLYTAGHLHHEVIDYEADKESSTNTGAVYLGIKRAEGLSFLLFTMGTIYWAILYFVKVISDFQLVPFVAAYVLHVILFLRFKGRFENKQVNRTIYRSFYRLFYFSAGMVLLGYKLYNLSLLDSAK